ncbi:MAG: tRNA-dihydrouridine synthase [Steroidobacteraceae bacterium]
MDRSPLPLLLRGFGPDILLYTEMLTAQALLHGDAARLLRHSPEEHPLALQLGGSTSRSCWRARRRWARRPATTRSTSTAAARASACSPVPSAPA